MGTISTGIGLASNLPIGDIVDALINAQQGPIFRLTQRAQQFAATDSGLKILSANMLTLTGSITKLGDAETFNKLSVANSNGAALSVTPGENTPLGTYEFTAIRKSSVQQIYSKGFANADQQTLGEGVITIAAGGRLSDPTALDVLNDGTGIRRGVFRITDGTGTTADIDITNAVTVSDVLDLINGNNTVSVEARVEGDGIVIEDKTGQSIATLKIQEVNGGNAAEDLGILKTASGTTISGNAVLTVSEDFTLDLINDGNGLRLFDGAPDIRISLTDDPTTEIEIDLDEAVTLKDVAAAINDNEDNNGKVLAQVINGKFVLQDLTGGGGTGTFQITDINDANVVDQLGLGVAAVGDTISGERIVAGINSVLLRNLRGGQGIDKLGSISLTDQAGNTATVELSGAESLNDVLNAINQAEDGGVSLNLIASLDELGTGIRIIDTSGSSVGNLVIADVGDSTLAAQLGIAVDTAESSLESGSLNLRYVNAATSVKGYAPGGGNPQQSLFSITDSAGNTSTISITDAVKNIGDVMQRINAASDINVVARLNETGDGFELVDLAGGTGELTVTDLGGGKAAEGLRLLGEVSTDGGGNQRVVSRLTTEIQITAEDTLETLVEKINAADAGITAAVIDDGSTLNSKRLVFNSDKSGREGALLVDSQGIDLGLTVSSEGADAILRVGSNPATAFMATSSTNLFTTGINAAITIKEVSEDPITVTISRNQQAVGTAMQDFVTAYNRILDASSNLTKFDSETGERGVLQGQGIVLRILTRLDRTATKKTGAPGDEYRTLFDLGVSISAGGKLVIDEERFQAALDDNPNMVESFFTEKETGFSARFEETIDSITDPFTGSITLQTNALKKSLESLDQRIGQLREILDLKRIRLVEQYARMETIISELNSQQSALSRLASLASPDQR